MIDLGLIIGYIFLVWHLLGAVAFPIMYMIKHPKEAKMTFLGIGGNAGNFYTCVFGF